MSSHSRTAEREEERRLNLRTLVIASTASAAAALLTSQLWVAGTWIAAAMTPVIVSLVSEILNRPTERIAKSLTSDRRTLAAAGGAGRPAGSQADPLPDYAPMEPAAGAGRARPPVPGRGSEAPIRVYRSGDAKPRGGRREAAGALGGLGARGQEAGARGQDARGVGPDGRGGAAARGYAAGGRGGGGEAATARSAGPGGRSAGPGGRGAGPGGRGAAPGGRGPDAGSGGPILGASGRPPLERRRPRRRKIAYGAVFATAALAFVIAVAALTLPELVAGGSVGKNDARTTFFGGGKKKDQKDQQAPQDTTEEEQPQPDDQQQPTTPEEEAPPPTEEEPPAEEEPQQQQAPAPGEPLPETTPAPPTTQP